MMSALAVLAAFASRGSIRATTPVVFLPRFVQRSKFVIQQSEFSGTSVGIPWRHNDEAFRLSGIDSL
jgi:hypothetical protein